MFLTLYMFMNQKAYLNFFDNLTNHVNKQYVQMLTKPNLYRSLNFLSIYVILTMHNTM